MIKLRHLICEIIAERMTYADLMRSSDPERADRAKRIPAKSLAVKSLNDREAWKFSYKTPKDENTTGMRHQGFIYFFKEDIQPGDNAMKVDCSVDCSCPDYKYRFSYANKQADAGENGSNSLNKGLNYPSSINRGPGLCKHLIALKEYLRTEIEGEPQQPRQEPTQPQQPIPQPTKPMAIPKSPAPGTVPPEEPEQPDVPQEPTQSPDVETELEPPQPTTDQTPQGPEEVPQDQKLEEPNTEEEPNNKKLKEINIGTNIVQSLDELCKSNPIFIVQYD